MQATVSPAVNGSTVTFYSYNHYEPIGTAQTDATGKATFTYTFVHERTYELEARHLSDASPIVAHQVVETRTPVAVTISAPETGRLFAPVPVTIATDPNPGGGTVTLIEHGEGGTQTVPVDPSGVTHLEHTFWGRGGYRGIYACFSGTVTHAYGCSDIIDVYMIIDPTTTELEVSPSWIEPGDPVTLRVKVTPGPEYASGVAIYDGSTVRWYVPINQTTGSGELVLSGAQTGLSVLSTGRHNLQARFGGTAQREPSNSPVVPLSVHTDPTTTAMVAPTGPVSAGVAVPVTASVSPSPGINGTVTFTLERPGLPPWSWELPTNSIGLVTTQVEGQPPGTYPFRIDFTGQYQYMPSSLQTAIAFVDVKPPGGNFQILNGPVVSSRNVALQINATDDYGPLVELELSNDGVSYTSLPFSTTPAWTLSEGNGLKTVWVRWRDTGGNWSPIRTDNVTLDTSNGSVSLRLEISAPSPLRVGDTITVTPVVEGAGGGPTRRCFIVLSTVESPSVLRRMQVASDACTPWTFTLPDHPAPAIRIDGHLSHGTDGEVGGRVDAAGFELAVTAGGSPGAFVSNYPVQSWAPGALISTATPSFNSPVTVAAAPGSANCHLGIFANSELAWVRQEDGCRPWTLVVPPPPAGPGSSFFGSRTDAKAISWSGASGWLEDRVEAGYLGAVWTETYSTEFEAFLPGPPGATYASDLPAIFSGPARRQVLSTVDPDGLPVHPVVIGATSGTCVYSEVPGTTVLGPSGCADPVVLPPSPFGDVPWGSHAVRMTIHDVAGRAIAGTEASVGYVRPMATLALVPSATIIEPGTVVSISAGVSQGAPTEYTVTIEAPPPAPSSGLALAPAGDPVVLSGTFSPTPGSDGDLVVVDHPFVSPGAHLVTATFRDVLGDERTSSTTILVATPGSDTTGPIGSLSIVGGAAFTSTAVVSIDAPASDPSGVVAIALSNDGLSWTTLPYAASVEWSLAGADGARTVWARWSDGVGNWSDPITSTIVLDSTPPDVRAPGSAVISATAVAGLYPVRVWWTGSDATSGVASYEIEVSTDGGAWIHAAAGWSEQTRTHSLAAGHTYRHRIRAVDLAGNLGLWAVGPPIGVRAPVTEARSAGVWSSAAPVASGTVDAPRRRRKGSRTSRFRSAR
jgi:hypothetical protein